MKEQRSTLIVALLCAVTVPAMAGNVKLSKDYEACIGASGGNTLRLVDCDVTETKRQDARLNRVYIAMMKKLPPERKQQLRAAQRLWIKYRDANCDFYYDPDGGSAARLAANSCYLMETAERAEEVAILGQMVE